MCLNGKLYPNFVEPRGSRNSCWSRSFSSLGQMQCRSCSKYHFILNNHMLYNIDYTFNSFEQKLLQSFNFSNSDSSTTWMHCWGSGNIALPIDIKVFVWQRTTIFSCYRFICCNFFSCCRYVETMNRVDISNQLYLNKDYKISNWFFNKFNYNTGFNYSGGYYNPVLATGLKMGCRGHSHVEFGLVYWLAASIGAIASIYVYPVLKNSFGIKAKTE